MALIDKASLLMVPSTYEDGTLYNVLPSGNKAPDETGNHNGYDQTRADFTFSRGSNLAATRVNSDGLIEKGRENLLTYSRTFTSDWLSTNATITSGQSGYDGSNNAVKVTADADGAISFQQGISFSNVNTFSVYLKAGNIDFAKIFMVHSGANRTAVVNLVNGTIEQDNNGDIPATITSISNGWYRCTISANSTSGSIVRVRSQRIEGDDNVLAGDFIYIQDAQLEKGLVATDYIETGSSTAQAGILEDMPRINYDANGENGALLLESSRTNLITQSEYFGAWTASGLTISSNEATSPEGVSNAAKLTLPSGSAIKRIALGSMPVTAVARSYSFFVKSDDINAIQLVHSGDVQGYARFDISSGVVGSKGSKTTSDIEDYGNGWYRCIANFDATNSFGSTIYLYINDSATGGYGGSTSEQGDLFIYGAQYEAASYPSSYIPSYGSAVTRSAENNYKASISDLIGQTEGTMFVEVDISHLDGTAARDLFFLSNTDNVSNDWIGVGFSGIGSNTLRGRVVDSSSLKFDQYGTISSTGTYKIALAYKNGEGEFYVNGASFGTNYANTSFTLTLDRIFNAPVGFTSQFADGVKQMLLFKERLSNTELATLTTL